MLESSQENLCNSDLSSQGKDSTKVVFLETFQSR